MEPEIFQVLMFSRFCGYYFFCWPFVFISCAVDLCRYYLFALILSLTRDVYELGLLMECEARNRASKVSPLPADPLYSPSTSAAPAVAVPVVSERLRQKLHVLLTVLYNNPPLLLDLLKNSCDIFIPLDRLGIYSTGSGFVGACGLASSLLSIVTIIHPWLKLKPWTRARGGVLCIAMSWHQPQLVLEMQNWTVITVSTNKGIHVLRWLVASSATWRGLSI